MTWEDWAAAAIVSLGIVAITAGLARARANRERHP